MALMWRRQVLASKSLAILSHLRRSHGARAAIPAARLDIKYIVNNISEVNSNIAARHADGDANLVAQLDQEHRTLITNMNKLRHDRKRLSAMVRDAPDREEVVAEVKEIKRSLSELEERARLIEAELQKEAYRIPNRTHPATPIGEEECASLIKEIGRKPDQDVIDYESLANNHSLIDFPSASRVSGPKFYYLKHEAALLEMALTTWSMNWFADKGWTPVMTPDLVKLPILHACGFQPRHHDDESHSQTYEVANHNLALVATAEIPLAGMYYNSIIDPQHLPIKMVGFSHCFRSEAGAGQEERGLYRVHQFSKVELFALCKPEDSEQIFAEICDLQEQMYTELGLHFRVLEMPTGDLGAPAYRKVDMEAWIPSKQAYGEISSTSNCTDYQSRRLNIRFRSEDKSNEFVHTLNGTAVAVPRLIISLLEQGQTNDGNVRVPECLRRFLGGKDLLLSDEGRPSDVKLKQS